jgi:glyoxylase-like metal-dependent hydrolase (beta-lactamase superfamily II)
MSRPFGTPLRRLTVSIALAAGLAGAEGRAQPGSAPTGAPGLLRVQGNIHMLVVGGMNIAVQTGNDGVLLVDAATEASAQQVIAAIRTLSDKPIHTIVNSHVHADHTGGNDALVKMRGTGASQPVRVIAQDNVLRRLQAGTTPVAGFRLNAVITVPINSTYDTPSRDFYLNGESIIVYHAPAAHTDGDSIVHFRGSDVLAVGDLYNPDRYPVIDIANGGSVQGLIAALNKVLELTVPARFQEGGTYVIPGHGRLSDEADVVEYRDMVTIIRDRVQDLIAKRRTWDQVRTSRPSRDYDPEYGTPTGPSSPDQFVEAIYKSLGGK